MISPLNRCRSLFSPQRGLLYWYIQPKMFTFIFFRIAVTTWCLITEFHQIENIITHKTPLIYRLLMKNISNTQSQWNGRYVSLGIMKDVRFHYSLILLGNFSSILEDWVPFLASFCCLASCCVCVQIRSFLKSHRDWWLFCKKRRNRIHSSKTEYLSLLTKFIPHTWVFGTCTVTFCFKAKS